MVGTAGTPRAAKTTRRTRPSAWRCLWRAEPEGLNPGRHIVTQQAHPAQVLVSAMNAVGVVSDTLGEVQGTVPELFA